MFYFNEKSRETQYKEKKEPPFKNDRALGNELINQIQICLHGCNIYVNRLLPGGKIAKCVAASSGSEMLDTRLPRGNGVSFNVIDKGAFLLVDSDYEGLKSLHKFYKFHLPYLCVPLFGPSDSVLGYIGVDTFDEVPRSHIHEKQPELGIPEWLCQVGKEVGSAMSFAEEAKCLQFIKDVVGNDYKATVMDAYGAAFSAINALILHAESMALWKMDHKTRTWNVECSVLRQSDVVNSFLNKKMKFVIAKSYNNKDDLFMLQTQERLNLSKEAQKDLGIRIQSPQPRCFMLKGAEEHIVARFQTPHLENAADATFVIAAKYVKDRVGKGDYIRYLGRIATTLDTSIQCILQRGDRRKQRNTILEETEVKCKNYDVKSNHISLVVSLSQTVIKGIPGCYLFRVWACEGGRLELAFSSYPDKTKAVPISKLEEETERTSLHVLNSNRCVVFRADTKPWHPQDEGGNNEIDWIKQSHPEEPFKDILQRHIQNHFVYAPMCVKGARYGLLEVEFKSEDVDEFGENYALENGVVEYIKEVGNHLGKIFCKHREDKCREVARLQKDVMPSDIVSTQQVWKVLFDCVRLAVPLAQHLEIWKLDDDLHLYCIADAAGRFSQPVPVEVSISHGRCVSSIMHSNGESFVMPGMPKQVICPFTAETNKLLSIGGVVDGRNQRLMFVLAFSTGRVKAQKEDSEAAVAALRLCESTVTKQISIIHERTHVKMKEQKEREEEHKRQMAENQKQFLTSTLPTKNDFESYSIAEDDRAHYTDISSAEGKSDEDLPDTIEEIDQLMRDARKKLRTPEPVDTASPPPKISREDAKKERQQKANKKRAKMLKNRVKR
jgi:hypothetical protein